MKFLGEFFESFTLTKKIRLDRNLPNVQNTFNNPGGLQKVSQYKGKKFISNLRTNVRIILLEKSLICMIW